MQQLQKFEGSRFHRFHPTWNTTSYSSYTQSSNNIIMYCKHFTNCMFLAMCYIHQSHWKTASSYIASRDSSTGASRFTSSQKKQGFLLLPWLLNNINNGCRPLVYRSSAKSHSLSHHPFLATLTMCEPFSSHCSILTILSSFPITSSFTSSYLPWQHLRSAAGHFSLASFPGRFHLQFLKLAWRQERGITKLVPKLWTISGTESPGSR